MKHIYAAQAIQAIRDTLSASEKYRAKADYETARQLLEQAFGMFKLAVRMELLDIIEEFNLREQIGQLAEQYEIEFRRAHYRYPS